MMIFNISGGGGAALNFRIVGGTTAPTNPAENCIWVNTDAEITSWIFSPEEPSPAESGMVWIFTGLASNVAFNALKKNVLQIFPLSAKQYVNGSWVSCTAQTYQSGAWVDWWTGGLYVDGDQFIGITGGWWNNTDLTWSTASSTYPNSGNEPTFGDNITLVTPASKCALATTINPVDVSNFTELQFTIVSGTLAYVVIHSQTSGDLSANYAAMSSSAAIDISALQGKYYITVLTINNRTVEIGDIKLV